MSVLDDISLSSHLALQYYYGRVYESLLESDDKSRWSWYIDDRAEPDLFWKLLSVANPELYRTMRETTRIPKSYLIAVRKFLSKEDVKENVNHLLTFTEYCFRCGAERLYVQQYKTEDNKITAVCSVCARKNNLKHATDE